MSKAQTDLVVGRIQSLPFLVSKTFKLVAPRDGAGRLPAPAYVVVQPADGTDSAERFTGARSTAHPRYVLHVVGETYDHAQGVLEDVKELFIDPVSRFPYPINVAGELARNIVWDGVLPVQVDNDVTPPIIYATAELSWDADPI